jgi:hypothetical protein
MDLLSYYGWFAFGGMTAIWLVIVGARVIGRKWRPRLALACTASMVLFGGALMANDRWGSTAKHEALCENLRQRYERAANMMDLERARVRMRETRCPLTER